MGRRSRDFAVDQRSMAHLSNDIGPNRIEKGRLNQPHFLRHAVGHVLKRKPGQRVLQVADNPERFTDGILILLTQIFDLSIMPIKERIGIGIVDQTSDHARDTTVVHQVRKEALRIFRGQSLFGHLGGNVSIFTFLLKKISDFRIRAYNICIHDCDGLGNKTASA